MQSIGLRERLKSGTREHHARLDGMITGFDLSSFARYAAFLSLHARVLLPVERWLEQHDVEAELPDWRERRRATALLDDLATLGMRIPDETGGACIPVETTPASRAGVLYVIEGSRLGGAVLARRVSEGGTALPTSFLRHGAEPSLWPSFVQWLNERNFDAHDAGIAVRSARTVFEIYRRAIERETISGVLGQ